MCSLNFKKAQPFLPLPFPRPPLSKFCPLNLLMRFRPRGIPTSVSGIDLFDPPSQLMALTAEPCSFPSLGFLPHYECDVSVLIVLGNFSQRVLPSSFPKAFSPHFRSFPVGPPLFPLTRGIRFSTLPNSPPGVLRFWSISD